MIDNEDKSELYLQSSRSTEISLSAIRSGDAGLNTHRQNLLNRVPESGDWAPFKINTLELIDLAYLTAKTGHEFTLLRGKKEDILFHGIGTRCDFPDLIIGMLYDHKLVIVGHSHPGEEEPEPSLADRQALRKIGQERSTVVSAITGRTIDFTGYF